MSNDSPARTAFSDDSSTPPNAPGSVLRVLLMFGSLMLLGTLGLVWLGTPPASEAVGQPLPPVDLTPLLNVASAPTSDDLKGKVAVLHFWGTWCPPCRLEFPEFVALANKFADQPQAVIVSVSCSGGPEYDLEALKSETEKYLSGISPGMKTYSDPAGMTRGGLAMILAGGSFGYPTTVLVDREGNIAEVLQGYREGAMRTLERQIEDLLN